MTEKERYEIIIDVLAEKVKEKSERNALLSYRTTDLERKLAEAEFKLNEQANENAIAERTPCKK